VARQPRVLIAGGAGVFGRLLVAELVRHTDAHLLLAGRSRRRLAAACQRLDADGRVVLLPLDLQDAAAVRRAATGCAVLACTAGPFQTLPRMLPWHALAAGAHWLDVADDPTWLVPLLRDPRLAAAARAADRCVIPGLSSVPALSGVLARWCRERAPAARRGRVTLFIGNRNPKGAGAIASALATGFRAPRTLALPVGRRLTYRFEAADTAILQAELGLEVEFRVAFEWGAASRVVAALAPVARRLDPMRRARLARVLAALAAPFSRLGSDLGGVDVTLWDDTRRVSAALVGRGQRLAILPCALAVEALLDGSLATRGVLSPATWLTPTEWIARLAARGLRFVPAA
jgi:hypothetical protein